MTRIVLIALCAIAFAATANARTMLTSYYNAPGADIAANRTLPFGTLLRLTNPRNGRSTTVHIRDRGPFVRGRDLDISRSKAAELEFTRSGVAPLWVEVLYLPREKVRKVHFRRVHY